MNIALISSKADKASTTIKNSILSNFEFKKSGKTLSNNKIYTLTIEKNNRKIIINLYTFNEKLIDIVDIDKKVNADYFFFISKHVATQGRASLTVHPIGNFSKAEFGGEDCKLCICPSLFLKTILRNLTEYAKDSEFEVTTETTHHGPYLEKPVLFVELGSTEEHWENSNGGNIIAKAVIDSIENYEYYDNENVDTYFLIGGTHYSHVSNKVNLLTKQAVGHILPRYHFKDLNAGILNQALEKIIPKPKAVMLDWKGLGPDKHKIVTLLEENNVRFVRSDQFFKENITN